MSKSNINNKYDLIIIGGGIAGINTALTAIAAGLRTVIFERDKLGGISFNGGDLLMKKLYDAALVFKRTKEILVDEKHDLKFDLKAVLSEMEDVRKNHLEDFLGTFLKHNKLEIIYADAKLVGRNEVKANGETYQAKFIVLATGSKLREFTRAGSTTCHDIGLILKADQVEKLTEVPENLVIVGGGTIAFELAVLFNLIGSKVTMITRGDFLTGLDRELRDVYLALIDNDNLTLVKHAHVEKFQAQTVYYEANGEKKSLSFDRTILATGFEPHVIKIADETIAQNEKGVIVNEYLQTSIPNIYAVGNSNEFDAKSTIALTEGIVAVNHMIGQKKPIDLSKFVHTIIGEYQYGMFGKTEEQLIAENVPYLKQEIIEKDDGTANRKLFFLKVLFHKHTLAVLGVHLIGDNAVQQINIVLDLLEDNNPFKLDNRYHFTDDAYLAGNIANKALSAMNLKIINEDFASYYQAKVDLTTGKFIGAESLGRFKVDGKFTNPLPFITAFEKNGYIADLDIKSLENACLLLHDLEKAGIKTDNFTVSVNVSPYTLRKITLDRFAEIMTKYQIDPAKIMLEITERAAGEDIHFIKELGILHEAGFKISMDDFSAGHSSLTLLNTFRFDEIKIDMSVLPKDVNDTDGQNVYKNLVSALQNSNATIVAEGIEEKFHHEFLVSLGVKEGQGYYFARPESKEDFINSLKTNLRHK